MNSKKQHQYPPRLTLLIFLFSLLIINAASLLDANYACAAYTAAHTDWGNDNNTDLSRSGYDTSPDQPTTSVGAGSQLNLKSTGDNNNSESPGYDSIVRGLMRESRSSLHTSEHQYENVSSYSSYPDPFDEITIHAGIGLASTWSQLRWNNELVNIGQSGVQASLGIDLFSKHWLAQGSARSFGENNYRQVGISLKEFDLRLTYHDQLSSDRWEWKGSIGLSARYLTLRNKADLGRTEDFTTPSSFFSLGTNYAVNSDLEVGIDLGARNSLIEESLDQNSIDSTIHLDAHF